MAPDGLFLGGALGLSGADIVLADRFQHTRAGEAELPRAIGESQRDHRQDIAFKALRNTADRQNPELEAEDKHQQHADDEGGHRGDQQSQPGRNFVPERILFDGREHPDGNADQQGKHDRAEREGGRNGKPLGDLAGDRQLVLIRRAEVEVEYGVADVIDVAHNKGIVVAQLLIELRDCFRRGPHPENV